MSSVRAAPLLHTRARSCRLLWQGHEWEVHVDDGSKAVVHRTELVLAPEMVTEESLEAARLGRRKQTNRDHSVPSSPSSHTAHAGLGGGKQRASEERGLRGRSWL